MKLMAFILLFLFTTSSFAEIYKRYDRENHCTLYYSTFSAKYFKEGTSDKRASIAPGLNFERFEGEFNLKGLWSLFPLELDVNLGNKVKYFMTHEFTHACISEEGEIIHISEPRRRLMNNWNDYDRE